MSVRQDVVDAIEAIDSNASVTVDDIDSDVLSYALQTGAEEVESDHPNVGIVSKDPTGSWTTAEEETYGLHHMREGMRLVIKAGKAVFPYRCQLPNLERCILITKDKIFSFPTNNVNYFNAARGAVADFGAEKYFTDNNQTTYASTSNTNGTNYVANYNYQQTE